MTLKAKLTEDMKAAMRAKDQTALGTIRLINAAIKQFEVDERTEADDARVAAILGKMIKQRKDSAKIYADAGRQDLADKENAEIEVLNCYLPEMLSETRASGMADMGKVMGALKSRLAGKADMALVNQAVKAALSR